MPIERKKDEEVGRIFGEENNGNGNKPQQEEVKD